MAGALRFLMLTAALGFSLVAIVGNATFWWVVNDGTVWAQWFAVAVSVTASVLKTAVPAYLAAAALRWRDRPKLIFVAFVALALDMWSGVGASGYIRELAASHRAQGSAEATSAKAALPGKRAELAKLPDARPAGLLIGLSNAKKRVAGDCPATSRPTPACSELAKLDEEYAVATTRDSIAAEIAKLEKLATAAPSADTQPDAAAVTKPLRGWGFNVSDDTAAFWRAVLLILLVELVPPAVLAEILKKQRQPPAPIDAPAPAPAARAPRAPSVSQRFDVSSAIAALPAASDGWRQFSQRDVAARYKVSAATVGRAVDALVSSGQLEKRASSRGTYVRPVTN